MPELKLLSVKQDENVQIDWLEQNLVKSNGPLALDEGPEVIVMPKRIILSSICIFLVLLLGAAMMLSLRSIGDQQDAVARTPDNSTPSTTQSQVADLERAADKVSPDSLHPAFVAKEARRQGIGELRFYGRVVDQDGKPVDKANVRVTVSLMKTLADVPWEQFLVTDANGQFRFDGFLGTVISIRGIEKPGYIMGPRTSGQSFIVSGPSQDHQPDPENPVVFRITKKPDLVEPLLRVDRHVTIKRENLGATYTLDLLRGATTDEPNAEGDIRVALERNILDVKQRTYDWSATLSAVDGGFVEIVSNDQDGWIAPADGYEPQLRWAFKANQPNWVGRLSRYVFIRSRRGQLYGRLTLKVESLFSVTELIAVVRIRGLVNPNHSRMVLPDGINVFTEMDELEKFKALSKSDINAIIKRRAAQRAVLQEAARQEAAAPRKEKRPAPGFFGKIVDQEGQAVVGAKVQFRWVVLDPETGLPVELESGATTDDEGRFHFDNAPLGRGLYVRAMSKHGYLAHPKISDPKRTHYTVPFGGYDMRPLGMSADTPWIFPMWKQTEPPVPLIVARQRIKCDPYGEWALADLHDPSGSWSVADLLNKSLSTGPKVAEDAADLRLRVVRSKKDIYGIAHDWEFAVEAINGGIVEARPDDPFMYSAPENGYQPKLSWTFKRNDPAFSGHADRHIYFRADDGKTFAYVNLYVESMSSLAIEEGPNNSALIRFKYRLNPTGSRNLLPDRKHSVQSLKDYPQKHDER